ncbi:MAG: TIGR03118 family protein, partial [Pirellulales bacterium]
GLALANNGATARLYATDFLGGKIDVFAPNFSPVTPSGSFTDPNLPAGYKPLNIQALGGELYVSYASPLVEPLANANGALPPVPAPGGVVDVFDTNGNFVGRIASGSPLDQPWGMALAPSSFGPFAGDLLVANHGDGKINVFDPTPSATGAVSLGTLTGADGNPFVIDGLWGLAIGNGDNAGDSGALYFTAGGFPNLPWPLADSNSGSPIDPSLPVAEYSHGLLGTIQVAGTDPLVAVGTSTAAQVGETFSGAVASFGSADLPSPVANPVASYTATIDWGDGSSASQGTVVPTGNGGFVVVGSHTFGSPGTDNYTVTIRDAASNSVSATGSFQVTPATLLATALNVNSPSPFLLHTPLAQFTDTGGADPLANYSATIDWGDGTVTSGIVSVALLPAGAASVGGSFGGNFYVSGTHTYAAGGDHTFTVAISDSPDSLQTSVTGTADVTQATLVARALPVTSQGLNVNSGLAEFIDTGGADPLSDYTATIDWGDGTTSAGAINMVVADPPGTIPFVGPIFFVSGSHTYATAGDHTFTVAIDDTADSLTTTATGTIGVAQATLVAHALPVESQGLTVNNASVAAFFDTGGSDPLSDYTATIDWGDGATTPGTVTSALVPLNATAIGGRFFVSGSHTFAAAGDYTFTVTISDTHDSLQTSVTGTLSAAAPTLSATALPIVSQGLSVDNATLASFIDTGGADASTDYTATIDWGDGTTTAGTIHEVMAGGVASGANGGSPMIPIVGGIFFVEGSHTYTAAGDYPFTVTIADTSDTLQTTVTGTVTVAQPTLTATAAPVDSKGLTLNGAMVAQFVDTGGADAVSDYTATINWGDGTSSTGTIHYLAPNLPTSTSVGQMDLFAPFFMVDGSHTYTATGAYTFTVAISDTKDDLQTTVTGTAHISPAPLLAVGVPVVVNTGLSVNGAIVAAFADGSGGDALTNYSATID